CDWKLCLSAGSGGLSAPKEPEAKKRNLPAVQLYHLGKDPSETNNLMASYPDKVQELLELLASQVENGRSTPGPTRDNDRTIEYLPKSMQ
ncbi:MAG: arylsulfatase, partial [Rubripirellula sp.]|nr:arylsulfatase [Rubripirellula sp.]